MKDPVGIMSRLAPTPSGFLHTGNALSFILTSLLTRENGGVLWLRIDDIDAERSRSEYEQDIFESLDWLGLDWDRGPRDLLEFESQFSQVKRSDLYLRNLKAGLDAGWIYACDCSRSKIQNAGHKVYPGFCRERQLDPTNTELTLRARVDDPQIFVEMGDFVVRRRGGLPSYQWVSLWEDEWAGINLIVRGEDLLPSTRAQKWLGHKLGLPHFLSAKVLHHPLLLSEEGKKLSKSDGALSLKAMRDHGAKASQIYRLACDFLGYKGAPVADFKELLDVFKAQGLKLSLQEVR